MLTQRPLVPPTPRTPVRATLAVSIPILALLLVAACGGGAGEPTAKDDDDAPSPTAVTDARTYQVRGQVTGLPDPADPMANFTIRHEAIDDFESMDGEVVGMSSMSMPFPVGSEVSLDGVEVGDKVSFTLEVDWDGDPAYQVTSLEALPADTELDYRKARPTNQPGFQTDN